MLTIQQAFDLALQHHQAGRLAEAEALYRQILAVQPTNADAMHLLGVLAQQVGRLDLAVEWIGRAIAINASESTYYCNLGNALAAQANFDAAIAACRRALGLKPECAEAYNNMGNAHKGLGQLDEAIAAYQHALQIRTEYPEAHNNLGLAMAARGSFAAAIAAYHRALQLNPNLVEVYNNLGMALRQEDKLDEAIQAYRQANKLQPNCAEVCYNLGTALGERGELNEAIVVLRRAVASIPNHPDVYNNLGNALRDQGQLDEAIVNYRRALEINPTYAEVWNNLGNALKDQGQLDKAVASYRRALEINPAYAEACNNLGNALKDQGQLDEAVTAYCRALEIKPQCVEAQDSLILILHYLPGNNEGRLIEEQRRWNRLFGALRKKPVRSHTGNDPERRLRVGYVSADFSGHVVGRNLAPLFRCHDHQNVEIICYSGRARSDTLTAEFRKRAEKWRSTAGLKDETLAAMIERDGVDILVDLSQHTLGNRLPLFALQPAPVQVSFAGYPESTGVGAIGYRISDRWMEECGVRNAECGVANGGAVSDAGSAIANSEFRVPNFVKGTERVYLLDSFWCYDPCGIAVEINGLPAKQNGHITFGSLNNFCKVNEPLLRLWARLLEKVQDSRLVLLSHAGSHRQRTVEFLEREGVEAHRVDFVAPRPRKEYLELYNRLDITLDTFPYNGHTTSLDALWMGVPVVSLCGERAVARAGLSQLSNLGLPELVARAEGEYVKIAAELANDLPRLTELRGTLRSRMEASVLMDAERFARQIEAAYRAMWRQECAENPS